MKVTMHFDDGLYPTVRVGDFLEGVKTLEGMIVRLQGMQAKKEQVLQSFLKEGFKAEVKYLEVDAQWVGVEIRVEGGMPYTLEEAKELWDTPVEDPKKSDLLLRIAEVSPRLNRIAESVGATRLVSSPLGGVHEVESF